MPRIDFYILAAQTTEARFKFCCRLAAKAWRDGHRVYIRTQSEADAQAIDTLLWSAQPSSFIPHGRQSDEGETPIVIDIAPQPGDLLINLAQDMPQEWQQRQRIAEIIIADPEVKDSGRQRYREYHRAGAKPHTHDIADQEHA